MDVTEALNARFTVRAFKPDTVNKEIVSDILESALRSPSWGNTQPWDIYVAGGSALERIRKRGMELFIKGVPPNPDVPAPQKWPPAIEWRTRDMITKRNKATGLDPNDKATRLAISKLSHNLFGAPIVIYLCMDNALGTWSMFDLGAISQSIMLAATEKGLGTAPAVMLVGYPGIIREEMKIPDNLSLVFGIALGYADTKHPQNKARSPRRTVKEAVSFSDF
ncbi:MAG: nitroreductase [Candidatus Altiarchaeia archaeon]